MSDLASHIIIDSEVDEALTELKESLSGKRTVPFVQDDFKVEHAKAVIAEAYVSEESTKYIIIAAKTFNAISQNALLKVFEEPPRNITFIIIVPSKSILLPTIRSRMPIAKTRKHQKLKEIEFDFKRVDNAAIFNFLKEHERAKKEEAKELLEALFHKATVVDKLILNKEQLECFTKAYKLLELNSRVQSVLALVLMSFTGQNDVD